MILKTRDLSSKDSDAEGTVKESERPSISSEVGTNS